LIETLVPVASGLLILVGASVVGCILLAFVSRSDLSHVVTRLRLGLIQGAHARRLWLVLIVTILAVVLALADVASPLRVAVTLLFLLAVPGLALALAVGIEDAFPLITVSIATSLSLAIVLAGTLLYAGVWVPEATLLVLAATTTLLWLVAAYRNGMPRRQEAPA
jgi:uncharacterized membrane protein